MRPPKGSVLWSALLVVVGAVACESSQVDDQAKKELEVAGDRLEQKAERVGDAIEDGVAQAGEDVSKAGSDLDAALRNRLDDAEVRAGGVADRIANAKTSASADIHREMTDAKATVEIKLDKAKRSSADAARHAIADLEAALDELDAKLEPYETE